MSRGSESIVETTPLLIDIDLRLADRPDPTGELSAVLEGEDGMDIDLGSNPIALKFTVARLLAFGLLGAGVFVLLVVGLKIQLKSSFKLRQMQFNFDIKNKIKKAVFKPK